MTYIYVMPLHENYNGCGFAENGGLPPPQEHPNDSPENHNGTPAKGNCCSRFLGCCRKCDCCQKKLRKRDEGESDEKTNQRCFCCKGKKMEREDETVRTLRESKERGDSSLFSCCCIKPTKTTGYCGKRKEDKLWANKRESISNERSSGNGCKRIFCCTSCCRCCRKKKMDKEAISRRESMMSKKKSLTSTVIPPEIKPKIDSSLVEHSSHMKGAIPILPIPLAWLCLILNVFLPGIGTIFSGMFCLCLGKPRFSQTDGPRPRIGAFIINLIIGCGQLFTVLFCLVGWGWSIWWGVIMTKVAKKHNRIIMAEKRTAQEERPIPVVNENHHTRDPERGS